MPNTLFTAELALFNWLALRDPQPGIRFDAVIGFGHFDMAIPRRCAELVREGRAQRLIFTGGIGAGTADLGQPEANAFLDVLRRDHPDLAPQAIVENRSTNTGDNIRFTRDLLLSLDPPLALGEDIQGAILVATPCRQRRVSLTWEQILPDVAAWNAPPPADYEALKSLYAAKEEDIRRQLVGEVERIRDYPARGWIAPCEIPADILDAYDRLRSALASS